MATFVNQAKNSSTFTGITKGTADITWDEALFTWDEGAGNWDDPFSYANQTKNTSAMTNQTKN